MGGSLWHRELFWLPKRSREVCTTSAFVKLGLEWSCNAKNKGQIANFTKTRKNYLTIIISIFTKKHWGILQKHIWRFSYTILENIFSDKLRLYTNLKSWFAYIFFSLIGDFWLVNQSEVSLTLKGKNIISQDFLKIPWAQFRENGRKINFSRQIFNCRKHLL